MPTQKTDMKGPVLLYGAGREALSSRRFLHRFAPGTRVDVCVDEGRAEIPDTLQVPASILLQDSSAIPYKTIIRSPGVSIYKPELRRALSLGIEITTNVNLWARYRRNDSTVIAITGTKGKSTTAKLLFTILQAAGLDAGLAGNIGVPVLELGAHPYVVLELSSFQCADLELAPDFVALTSLFPEHLDWHGTGEKYFADKLNLVHRNPQARCAMSRQALTHQTLSEKERQLDNTLPPLEKDFSDLLKKTVAGSRLVGEHNLHNAILAARIAIGLGLKQNAILRGIKDFQPLPHRLEEMALGQKTFVNDSIATNPEATKAAILGYAHKKPDLIIGGYDRDQDYGDLAAFLLTAPISHIWFLPGTGHRIARMIERENLPFTISRTGSLQEIFSTLQKDPNRFETLILSPGAPSYNQFENFEERGRIFLELAQKTFG